MKLKHKRAQYAEAVGLIVLIVALFLFILIYPTLIKGEKTKLTMESALHADYAQREMFTVKYLQAPVKTHDNQIIKMSDLIRMSQDNAEYRQDLIRETRQFMSLETSTKGVSIPSIHTGVVFVPGWDIQEGWKIRVHYPNTQEPLEIKYGPETNDYEDYEAFVPASRAQSIKVVLRLGFDWAVRI